MSTPYQDATLPIEERVQDLLSRMTLAEKIGQLCQTPMLEFEANREAYLEGVRQGRWGSRILADTAWAGNAPGLTVDPSTLNEIQRVAVEESRLGIPLIVARDVIYGQQTVLPIPLAQAASWNPQLVQEAYRGIAREAASLGIHWTFAPMLDIVRDPRWGRVIESSGEDPYLSSQFARAVVNGFQGENLSDAESLLACAKHFVGYGAAEGGRDYDTTEITDNTLHNVYLPPFKAALEAGVGSLMSGFNDLGGEPVSGSRRLIRGWLKESQGFDGLVVSDWGSISDLAYFGVSRDAAGAATMALKAGVDMAMTNEAYEDHLANLLDAGNIDIETINDSVCRVLRAKFRVGLFESTYVDEQRHLNVMRREDHVAMAQHLAEQSMVLLKNRQQILPLARKSLRVAVIGPHAHSKRQHLGSWCLDGKTEDVTSIYEGLVAAAPELEILTEPADFSDDMVECARRADVVILCVGESHRRTGEARNIAELALPAGQEQLITAIGKTGKPLVVVQCGGRPIPSPAAEQYADALLFAWQAGTETGHAVARILLGYVSPSGRLPMTMPRTTGQVPIYYGRKPIGKMRDFQDYQPYKDESAEPLYPFGFGLTYSQFSYKNLHLSHQQLDSTENLNVTFELTNEGAVTATEVAQCYVRLPVAETTRPTRELKDFARITLKPGETRTITLQITPEQRTYFALGKQQDFDGQLEVFVGGDCNATLQGHCELSPR
ncbi:glycoside hydrolase family 3 N-terminal domain-containing protein [Endozoicomonas elysicola]|uniref:beta-glucosidase n=1 Tax=Endozoicomonas elysicola TaxID=305900 RepID=A0A081KBG7_9GAMM|nr:glycoside hydrolase family 3 N-terminal domain-containing protein [Endozoicomonas elysicola]KEI71493.1 glycosidase [Endozoicomonas elysicola]